jgi:hypothetical protein
MGELFVAGEEAGAALAYALVTNPPALGRGPRPLLDDLRPGRRDHRRPDRLPPGPERFLVVANARNAQVVSDALAERLDGFKAVLDDRSLATALVAIQGPRSLEILAPLTDVDLARSVLRDRRGDGRRDPGPRRPDRLHRRGRLRGVRRRPRRGELWDASRRPAGRTACADRPGRPRHAPARGRHAALRQRARPRDEPFECRSSAGR